MDGSTKEGEKRTTNRVPRNHFTRSRNSKPSSLPQKRKSEEQSKLHDISLEDRSDRSDDKPNISINACATILAELDSRSYHRSLIQDANNATEKILQPMSLPWTHKVVPVARNIPCDIDEMIDVITADDGSHTPFENGNFGFGQFETGRLRSGDSVIRLANSSENFRAVSRRSTDPGVIEFSTVVLPSSISSSYPEDLSMIPSAKPVGFEEHHDDIRSKKGATILRCFEAVQRMKRRKIEQARRCVSSFEVSVKINSSSSRSSIFSTLSNKGKLAKDDTPIVLEATLPLEVENGRRMPKTKAKIASEKLGSYDIQHGIAPLQSGKSQSRVPVGRTRLVWASKEVSGQPQRVSYTSLVTGERLENGAEKRPRNIQVRIKVDGDILCSPKTADHRKADTGIQASLQCDQLVQSLLDGRSDKTKFSNFIPPSIECIPGSAGSIHVVCTSPGAILQSSINPILKLASTLSSPCCTVCWRSTEGGLEVKECAKCGLLAHAECCLDPGKSRVLYADNDQLKKEEWTCSVCCRYSENGAGTFRTNAISQQVPVIKKSKRKTRSPTKFNDPHCEPLKTQNIHHPIAINNNEIKCSVCCLSGGAMSPISVEGDEFWVHEICRIWTGNQRYSSNSTNPSCVLCGATGALSAGSSVRKDASEKSYSSRCVVKCAAPGCHISVHPMCALVSSLTSQSIYRAGHESSKNDTLDHIQKAKKKDLELCSQYTLTFASVCGLAHSFGKDPGVRRTTSLPIFFCGIHNPAREQSFHGLYPGGKMMDREQTLKVPSC